MREVKLNPLRADSGAGSQRIAGAIALLLLGWMGLDIFLSVPQWAWQLSRTGPEIGQEIEKAGQRLARFLREKGVERRSQ